MGDRYLHEVIHLLGACSSRPYQILVAGLEALDVISVGVVVTDVSRRLLFANFTAEQILATRDGLELSAQGILCPLMGCCTSLIGLMRQATHSPSLRDSQLKEPIAAVLRPSGKKPLTLIVRSLHKSQTRPDSSGPAVLVFILDPELPVPTGETGLRLLYGLTSMEARLAGLLMEGNTVNECCAQLGIQLSTARMHLGNLFAKTGVQRQSQLVSLLLKSVGFVRSSDPQKAMDTGPILPIQGPLQMKPAPRV
jgi:DNA-binding CsgD family transcriptional regulator